MHLLVEMVGTIKIGGVQVSASVLNYIFAHSWVLINYSQNLSNLLQ
jgi:hypothetical protein